MKKNQRAHTNWVLDIETMLKNMKVISQRDVFKILSALIKYEDEPTSFTWLKAKLNLNPNSLSKHLKKLLELGLVNNSYELRKDSKDYSFYRISERGRSILHGLVGLPRVWELLEQFKEYCKSKGWKTSEYGDWVKEGDKYHNFLWTRTIRPETFENLSFTRPRFAVREDISYQIVDISYTAWLFQKTIPEKLIRMVSETSEISKRIALYDLSQTYLMSPLVLRLNKTNSEVFREFEYFLQTRWRLRFTDMESHMEESTD